MIFENLVTTSFADKVREVAANLKLNPDHLMAVMWSESRLNPRARNPVGGATGLIQFMPATARHLGTTCDALLQMDAEQQLNYVEAYFRPYAGSCRTLADLYLACFFPAAIGRPDNYVLQTLRLSAALIAAQNPAFDLNRDGQITAGEFRRWLKKRFSKVEGHEVLF